MRRSESVLQRRIALVEMLDAQAFNDMVKGFVDLYRVGIKVLDERGTRLADVKINSPAFCGYVFGFPEGRRQCTATVGRVKDGPIECTGGGRTPILDEDLAHAANTLVTVPCFTGLRYIIAPILWDGDVLGRVVFGPFMPSDLKDFPPPTLTSISTALNLSELKNLVDLVRKAPESTIARVMLHFGTLLQTMLFSGHKWFLTSQMHVEATLEQNRDLEERAQRLSEANVRLKELDRLKSSFLATVSHELRTPLTSIIGYSEMLAEGMAGELNGDQVNYVRTIMEKGETLLKLISNILDMSQIESGRVRLTFAPMDAVELVTSSVSSVAPQAQKKGVELIVKLPQTPISFNGDADRLKQVVVNLLNNAVKFTPRHGQITVTLSDISPQADLGAAGFRISVEDNGPGIPTDQFERIFGSFYQVDSSSTREHGGAGLGLAIVKSFVEAHGGVVRLASEVGRGSRFSIVLPKMPRSGSHVLIAPPVTMATPSAMVPDRFS